MYGKKRRVVDPQAINDARLPYCEYCLEGGEIEVHHILTRGSRHDDIKENLISLCKWKCHAKAHTAQISKAELWAIVAEREGMTVDEVEDMVRGMRA